MKKTKRIASLSMALGLLATTALGGITANAATYAPVSGGSTTVDKYLVMESTTNVPDVAFSFSITPGTAVPASGTGTFNIYAGNDGVTSSGMPTIDYAGSDTAATFTPGDTTYSSVQTGDTLTLDSGKKYAKEQFTLDFSDVTFKEPGIYRYLLTETSSGQNGITYDTQSSENDKVRVVDVYVSDNNGALASGSDIKYIIHDTVSAVNTTGGKISSDENDTKPMGFVNEYDSKDLTFSKTVSGNQGSRDKYFKFTLAITGAGAGTICDVDLSNADAAPTKTAATTYTAETMASANGADDNATLTGKQIVMNASGAATKDFYLQHGQSIVIRGLPNGAKYTLTEAPEDYAAAVAVTGDSDATKVAPSCTDTETGITADTTAAFTNTRNGLIPTGMLFTFMPYVLGLAAAGFVLTLIAKRKRA